MKPADRWDSKDLVDRYLSSAESFDPTEILNALQRYVPLGSSVLEIGMGPGNDFQQLSAIYKMTGSDISRTFLDRYHNIDPQAELLHLDARTLHLDRIFDALYSNKVLIHLTVEEVAKSFDNQLKILKPGGIAFHTFWKGEGVEFYEGIRFSYFTHAHIKEQIDEDQWTALLLKDYSEIKTFDSFYVILKKH